MTAPPNPGGSRGISSNVNNITTATYTYTIDDVNQYKRFNSSSPVTITVPTYATVPIPIGSVIGNFQAGTGKVTMVAASGVILNSRGGLLSAAGQFSPWQIKKVDTDEWDVIGDVGA